MDGLLAIFSIIIGSFFLGVITGISYCSFRAIEKGYLVQDEKKYKVIPYWKHGSENRRREEID